MTGVTEFLLRSKTRRYIKKLIFAFIVASIVFTVYSAYVLVQYYGSWQYLFLMYPHGWKFPALVTLTSNISYIMISIAVILAVVYRLDAVIRMFAKFKRQK